MVHKKKYDVATTFPNYDLHGAAASGNIGLVLYAITHGQPINAVLGGLLPLHAAASGGSVEVVQLLINQGADVNIPRLPSNTGPPIGVGGAGSLVGPSGVIGDHHHPGTPGDKLQKGGRLNSSSGTSQQASSSHGRPGSATNQQTLPIGVRGSTPLHFAAAMGHMDVVRLLLENGARPAMKDAEKTTPEMVARNAKQFRIADFIRDWQAQSPIDAPRTSLDAPGTSNQRLDVPSPDLNASTTSLPLGVSSPATQSTSSLGRYPNQPVRRPSLPSIYESPPSTSYLRPGSSKRQATTPEGPLSKLPFTIRRPKSAGTKESGGGTADDTASLSSHVSTSSRLNRIFKRPNLRPATASGALSTPSPKSSSPPPIGRSRSPSAGRVPEKDRSGGLLHGHLPHLPHLPRHHFHGSHHPHPVSRDAISGPFVHGQSPSTSIPDFARPELADGAPLTGSTNPRDSPAPGDVSMSPDELDEEDALREALNLTPGELQYAKMRGTLQDRKGSARTAPPAQMSFGLAPKTSAPNLNQYTTLSAKSSPTPSSNTVPVPRHRANLGPALTMTAAAQGSNDQVHRFRTETPQSSRSDFNDTGSLSIRVAHPVPSLTSLNQVVTSADIRNEPDYPSSPGASSGGSSASHDILRSPEGVDDSTVEQSSRHVPHPTLKKSRSLLSSPFSQTSPNSSPSVSSVGYAGSGTDYISAGMHSSPFIDGGRKVANRAQAQELVEAHRRAIESGHEQRVKTRRHGNGSSRHQTQEVEQPREEEKKPKLDVEPEDTGASSQQEEEDMVSLREKLAALGDLVQQERRLAKGEKQGHRWNRESALEDANGERGSVDLDKVGPSSMGATTILRHEMLDGYLRQGEVGGSERVRRPPTPKRDVFGRPVTPKQQKEARPTTPKEARPGTPKNVTTPTSSKILDAPRENRVLPPPSKTQPTRSNTQHLTLQQTKAISKSDLALGSHVNKDDLQGRERAWTTTDVRPRVGPAGSSRPSTAGAKPTQNKDGLTIDIIQTMPTPTDGPVTPLRNPSPIPPSPTSDRQSLQSRRRCASNPLRIDAKGAQEKALSNDSYDGHSKESPSIASHSDKPSQQTHSRPRKPSTPTGAKGEPSSVLLHRITTTPPNVAPVVNVVAPPFASFLSVSSNGNEAPESPSPTHSMPVPNLPSAVDLHNMHLLRAKEEAKKLLEGEVDARPTGTWNGSPPVTAGERRLGIGSGRRNDFGYDSVRSFNEEKGGERLWQPPTTETGKSTKSKLGGLFSRLKR